MNSLFLFYTASLAGTFLYVQIHRGPFGRQLSIWTESFFRNVESCNQGFYVPVCLLLKVNFQYSEALQWKHLISATLYPQSQMSAPLYCAHGGGGRAS